VVLDRVWWSFYPGREPGSIGLLAASLFGNACLEARDEKLEESKKVRHHVLRLGSDQIDQLICTSLVFTPLCHHLDSVGTQTVHVLAQNTTAIRCYAVPSKPLIQTTILKRQDRTGDTRYAAIGSRHIDAELSPTCRHGEKQCSASQGELKQEPLWERKGFQTLCVCSVAPGPSSQEERHSR
jgi:hypothetical protein